VITRPLTVRARDGYPLAADLFLPSGPPAAAALVAPAMGVSRRYYAAYAGYLARRGLAALTVDLRGIGGSRPGALRGFAATLHGWGELDLAGALDALGDAVPGAPRVWVGHSAGGQLLGLLEDPPVSAALLVGAQSGHWRLWPFPARLAMAAFWWAGLPALVGLFGYLPMRRLGQGEDVPAGVAREWAAWGRRREYLWAYAGPRGGLGFARYAGPLRSYAVADDRYAPPAAVEALAALYARARAEVRRVAPADVGERRIGHFGFFRPRLERTLWAESADWLLGAARGDRAA
jgi:predicted alpha/beta hydrolase